MSDQDVLPSGSVLVGDAELWTDTLRDGTTFEVRADARGIEGDHLVFSLLFEGTPNVIVPVLRIPLSAMPTDYDLLG
jgi:hypothetical protein